MENQVSIKQNLVCPSFYLHGVNGREDDLVGGDDNGEEFRGELQHSLILEHHSASSLDTRTFLNK